MNQSYDVCIVGAGASGLAAANSVDPCLRIAIIDKNRIPGRKILATGGGRCNLTNSACSGHQMTLDFFHNLGLETISDEEGRYYPYSKNASDVAKILTKELKSRDIEWFFKSEVKEVKKNGEVFEISVKDCSGTKRYEKDSGKGYNGTIEAERLILCTGGKAAPAFGTTGSGYELAKGLGHSVTRVYPILTGINCSLPRETEGVRAAGCVKLLEDGQEIAESRGEIQFGREGLSGICIFDLTPFIKARPQEKPNESFRRFKMVIDFAPDFTYEEIKNRESSFGIVTEALASWITPDKLKSMEIPVEGVWGWNKAQATAGGVVLDEIDMDTMESKICSGLYFSGEVMDVQGPCGGFNLQHAWESGIKAGKFAGHSLIKDR